MHISILLLLAFQSKWRRPGWNGFTHLFLCNKIPPNLRGIGTLYFAHGFCRPEFRQGAMMLAFLYSIMSAAFCGKT